MPAIRGGGGRNRGLSSTAPAQTSSTGPNRFVDQVGHRRQYDGYQTMVPALPRYNYNQHGGSPKSAFELHAQQLLSRHSRLRKARSLRVMKW
jgi:hypothetical protein